MLEPLKTRVGLRAAGASHGMTLIEVALVLVVLAVLAALALPDIGRRLERQRLQAAAQSLAADLADARFEAARRGQPLFVTARAGTPWCWAVAHGEGCDCHQPAACAAAAVHHVTGATWRGVHLREGLSVRMEPSGASSGPVQAAVLETARGERLHVEVSALGRARVCAPQGPWPGLGAC